MKEELLKFKTQLKVKDLFSGDYFRFNEENNLADQDMVCRIVLDSSNCRMILIRDNICYSDIYLDLKVIKLKPTKFENDTLYFEEI